MDPKIFKAYDIRGIYPDQLKEEDAYNIGASFAVFIKKISNKDNPKIIVGRDNRASSEGIYKELVRGINDMGVDVVNTRLSTTPLMYFSVYYYGLDGGIIITASHNPSQYNGFKFVREKAVAISEDTGLREIRDTALANNFVVSQKRGSIEERDPKIAYVSLYKNRDDLKDIKIVVDTANSVSGVIASQMFEGFNINHIFKELNSSFPNHEPDPLKKENIKFLQEEVIKNNAQMGISFDGDGDRVAFVDEKGEVVTSDIISALISSIILKDNEGAKIFYDVRSSNITRETIEKMGGMAMPVRIGHSFIKQRMIEEDAIFAAEYSGHYFKKQEDTYFEDPFFVVFKIMEEMKISGLSLSQLVEQFKIYFHSGEINFEVKDKEMILEAIKNKYSEGQISLIDGVRIDFDDYWLLVRASNTEPLLRLVVEAKTKELMEEKIREIQEIIK